MPQTATIKSLPVAFALMKAMQAEGVEWGEAYRGATRRALAELLEGRMDQLIDEHLEHMAELGQADRRNGCYRRWLLTELGDIELAVPRTRTAVVTVIEHVDRSFCQPAFFCPAEGMRRRSERDGVGYALWAEQGFLTATLGSVIDYAYSEQHIMDLAERFRAQVIIDRWNSTATTTRLQELGIDVVTMGQGYASLSPAMKETERLILARQIAHDANPIMRWNLANVAVPRIRPAT